MNVTELIDTISLFSFGTLATERQRKDYLRCLNFANRDIYLKLRNYREFLEYEEIEVLQNLNEKYIDFNSSLKDLRSIYNKDIKMRSFSLLASDNLNLQTNEYFQLPSQNKIILGAIDYNKNNLGNNFVKVFYLPVLKRLTENVINPRIETDITIYDDNIEHVLILGSIYYIFLSTNGQVSKLQSAYTIYNEKLKDIIEYYNNV